MHRPTRSENLFLHSIGLTIILLVLCGQFQPSVSKFILHPQDTTVLIGTNATFTCDVENGAILDWTVLPGNSPDEEYIATDDDTRNQILKNLNISWSVYTSALGSNATITIPGTLVTNNTMVMCRDVNANEPTERFSSSAKLRVLGAPSPPEPTAILLNSTFNIAWNEPFTWPNHSITQYTLLAELVSPPPGMDSEVLSPTQLSDTVRSHTLDGSEFDVCTEVLFEVTATSDLGKSPPGFVTAGIPRVPGSIPHDPKISVDLIFTQDVIPIVEITFKLPSICSFQEEEYQVNVYKINRNSEALVHSSNHTYRGNATTFVASETVYNLIEDKVYSFRVATPRGIFSANKTFNTTLIISSPTPSTTQPANEDEGLPYLYIGIGVGAAFVVIVILVLLVCCSILVCKMCSSKSDQKNAKKKKNENDTWDSFLTNQNDILRQARAENPRTASTYESIDEYQEKAMLASRLQQSQLDQKSSSLDRYQKHPLQQVPPPAVPDRRHSREESPYTTMGSAPSTLHSQQKRDHLKNQAQNGSSPQSPMIYPNLEAAVQVVIPNNDKARVSGGSAGYFSSASGGEDVNLTYDHMPPLDPLAEQTKQDLGGASLMASQNEGHFVQTEC